MRRVVRPALVTFGAAFLYALVRYVAWKGTSVAHVPVFVTNKAVAVTALVLLGAGLLARDAERRRRAGLAGLALTGLHVILAQAVLAPSYFPTFFGDGGRGGLTLPVEVALLAGSLAVVVALALAWPRPASAPGPSARAVARATRTVIALVGLHALALGWSGWWAPRGWPGGLPPITLLSFLWACGVLVVGSRRPRAGDGDGA